MRRGQLVHALEERLLERGILEGEIRPERVLVDPGGELRMIEEGFDLGAEDHVAPGGEGVVERLDAEGIARAVEGAGLRVPDREGEHAAELFRDALAPFLVAVEDGLGVAAGLEDIALRDELVAQLHEVVDLAVEDDGDRSVVAVHRLGTACEVDDREAAESERDGVAVVFSRDEIAVGVGSAVDDAVRHFVKNGLPLIDDAGESCKSAHSVYLNLSEMEVENTLSYIITQSAA